MENLQQEMQGKLLSDPKVQDAANKFWDYICSDDEKGCPTFGALTVMAKKTPFFIYDHPCLANRFKTAFATETSIGMSKDFFLKMLQEEISLTKSTGQTTWNIIPVLLHELIHITDCHHQRSTQFPPEISNIAQDIYNNQRIAASLHHENIKLGNIFRGGYGLTVKELAQFGGKSEEVIAMMLWDGENEKNTPEDLENTENTNISMDDYTGNNPSADSHDMNNQRLANILDEAGLQQIREEGLNLPEPSDKEAFEKIAEKMKTAAYEAFSESSELRNRFESTSKAGQQLDNYVGSYVKRGLAPNKPRWIDSFYNYSMDAGSSLDDYSDDFQGDFSMAIEQELNDSVYFGQVFELPRTYKTAAFIKDSSGSMPKKLLEEGLDVLSSMVKIGDNDHGFDKIYLSTADTTIRGDVIVLDENNIEQLDLLKVDGGGGTDFLNPIIEICKYAEDRFESHEQLSYIFIFTDMGAKVPRQEQLPDNCPPLVYITLSAYLNKLSSEDRKTIEKTGTVIEIDSSEYQLEISLDEKVSHSSSYLGRSR